MRRIPYQLCLLILCTAQITHAHRLTAETVPVHSHTDWQLKPSLKYDTLCLLNALSGDPLLSAVLSSRVRALLFSLHV